eukprot:CAMPEP_0184085948 /NCGR_PEP_ID=MMETSP0974-20121125/4965_1 /TAXON_ID=483370 /ORGANISM="non described non described, Strain CCMP2097" /LENGTH=87 /DNA_ID=CAMNT_0026388631 /DNA_START=37 /DNA_END=304 /DNA_ORIENTATION=-
MNAPIGMLRQAAVATKIIRSCVKDSVNNKMFTPAVVSYNLIKYDGENAGVKVRVNKKRARQRGDAPRRRPALLTRAAAATAARPLQR